MKLMTLFVCVLLITISTSSYADYLLVKRSATIKAEPSREGEILAKVKPNDHLELLNEGKQSNGYYSVWSPTANKQGWVYRTLVKHKAGSSDQLAIRTELSQSGFDGQNCDKHLQYGIPSQSDQILCRKGYAMGYNYKYKVADWVAYSITKESAHGANYPRGGFRVDRDIPREYRSGGTDYDEPVYDKGHLAPSAAIDFSRAANNAFLYSNMAPQIAAFNRNSHGYTGVWGFIEDEVRDWVIERDELYIIAGTFFEDDVTTIGRGVGVPSHFYKIILDPNQLESIAFWMPQDENSADQLILLKTKQIQIFF